MKSDSYSSYLPKFGAWKLLQFAWTFVKNESNSILFKTFLNYYKFFLTVFFYKCRSSDKYFFYSVSDKSIFIVFVCVCVRVCVCQTWSYVLMSGASLVQNVCVRVSVYVCVCV